MINKTFYIRKKDYKTNTAKKKFMFSSFAGKEYLKSIIEECVINEDFSLPTGYTYEMYDYIGRHLYSIINQHMTDIWESLWEDLSYEF